MLEVKVGCALQLHNPPANASPAWSLSSTSKWWTSSWEPPCASPL